MTMPRDVRQDFIEYCKQRLHHHSQLLTVAKQHPNLAIFYESIPFIQQRISSYHDVLDDIEYDMTVNSKQEVPPHQD